MDLNKKITCLKEITGYPVSQDIYEGNQTKYITFVYQDERPQAAADGKVIADQCDVYVNLYVPKKFDYYPDKDKIRDYLESIGGVIQSISVGIEEYGEDKVRCVRYDVQFAEYRIKED